MEYTVIGLQISKGSFNGFDYDNTKLHCLFDSESQYLNGTGVEIITVSNSFLAKHNIPNLLNKKIKVYYNKNAKIQELVVVE